MNEGESKSQTHPHSLVRPARTYSNGCKSLNRPDSGKVTAKDKGVYREVESEGTDAKPNATKLAWIAEVRRRKSET